MSMNTEANKKDAFAGIDAIIETDKVNRIFDLSGGDKLHVLKDISIKVPRGALTILKGPSGSGKTTLMNILGVLDAPNSGRLSFNGQDVLSLSDREKELLRRKHFGFVFQSVSLIPMMTVYENVEFSLRLSGYEDDYKSRVLECLKMVGLSARVDHMPQELSGGEQQRVAIARAIAHKPDVIFADEPTAELDSATAVSVVNIFKGLVRAEGVTFVMTTHDTSLMSAGDAAFTIDNGEISGEIAGQA